MDSCIPQVKLLYPDLTKRDISVSAIFGYYSRSNNTTDELIEKAWKKEDENTYTFERFIEKWIIGYRHNSLSEHPSLHFYVENISNIATKILEANSMGQNGVPVAYMEKSTRYVNMENAKVFNIITKYINSLEGEQDRELMKLYNKFDKIIDKELQMYNSRLKLYEDICEKNGVPKSKAFDSARHYLPAGISSIVGVSLNVRAAKEVIINLLSNGNCEAYMIGQQLLDICCMNFGSIFKREEILYRVTYRSNLLRSVLSEDDSNSHNKVLAQYINPNYGFLKSLKRNTIIPFEKIKEKIMKDFYNGNDFCHITKHKIPHNSPIKYKTFFDVYSSINTTGGHMIVAEDVLNFIYKNNNSSKINTNDIPDDAHNNYIEMEVRGDYGSYRDIARHRRIQFIERNFYSHSLIEKLYRNDVGDYSGFFTYYIEGIITDIPDMDTPLTSSNKVSLILATYKYYIELTVDILDLLIDIKKLFEEIRYDTIEANVLLLEILSYLLPMSTEKIYKFRGSLIDIIHLVQERIQPAGHLYYRSIASSIWNDIKRYYHSEDFINLINNELSVQKEPINGAGSIWKDVGLSIEDKIIQI